jgi:hypothetical protein
VPQHRVAILLFEDQMQGFADPRVIVDDEHERLSRRL